MNSPTTLNLINLRNLLARMGMEYRPARQGKISMTAEQYSGDPTEEIASYATSKAAQAPIAPRPHYAGLEDFERDYHWFLA
jgi:hypothetical protein